MTTDDLKKGSRIMLANGWEADLLDNKKGNVRMAKVYGTFTESGSVYSHDIPSYLSEGEWKPVEHTDKQLKHKEMLNTMGF